MQKAKAFSEKDATFFMMTQMHKGMDYSPIDVNYWKENGRI
jgi:hypothetical protein